MPIRAKIFIAIITATGVALFATACLHWHDNSLLQFACFVLIAMLASTMKVRLPGMESTMSVHFLVILLGVLQLSLGETLVIGSAAALVQSLWKTKNRPQAVKVIFNVLGMTPFAVSLTYFAYHLSAHLIKDSTTFLLLVAACTYFLSNTVTVAIVIALSQNLSARKIWAETFFWSFPYYLVGAAMVGFVNFSTRYLGWQNALFIVPVMYWIYRTYQMYLGRLEDEKRRAEIEEQQAHAERRHVQEVSGVLQRTIEGLALAIDAKDHTTHQHLHRVRTYAVEIALELGLTEQEMEAIRVATLLHDIGKLAVPDHIINKPGRLSPEEFEKMKIHPTVGADILDKIAFNYPVASIVRAHHEKWNGQGYPYGLKGEEIPIGARILAAVDCLDALSSDRQYRKALPLDEAMKKVAAGAGTSFDPRVVEILERRYLELESLAVRGLQESQSDAHSFNYIVERGEQPDAGFELNLNRRPASPTDFLSSIASARQEAHTLFELSQDLGNSLSLDETLSLFAMRLRKLVPYDSIVAFIRKGDLLMPEFVSGENFRLLSSLEIPVGSGLCGWVARNARPIVNGNPSVETGFAQDARKASELRSALAVPLEGINGPVGVLALYQAEANAFTSDHLRVLQVITSKLALFIENALKYRQAEKSAISDFLTGMPNARALSMHLDQELARCKREHSTAAIMVCDLNGFKKINDRHGHLAGDKVLKIFAGLLRRACREYDYAARMGGDEFVIVAPNMTPGSVSERATLLNAMAQEASREVCGTDMLSVSLGAVFYPQDGSDTEHLLAEADRKMYAAKQRHYQHGEELSTALMQHLHLVPVN
jgi:diguanylate cyclase (GGDEF)-like protein/putative nucleotidyltransferase with HDIG domain